MATHVKIYDCCIIVDSFHTDAFNLSDLHNDILYDVALIILPTLDHRKYKWRTLMNIDCIIRCAIDIVFCQISVLCTRPRPPWRPSWWCRPSSATARWTSPAFTVSTTSGPSRAPAPPSSPGPPAPASASVCTYKK